MQPNNEIVQHILNVFQGFRMAPTPIDQYDTVGKQILADKMLSFVNKGIPIEFAMLGYPMKSSNYRDKVIGTLPDMAEEVSLYNFKRFNELIQQFYKPGVIVNIVNDGYVFNDLLGVADNTVASYQEVSMDMGKNAPMKWFNLTDFYKDGNGLIASQRNKLMDHFGITEIELERRILLDPDVNYLYRGMMRFMEEELAIKEFPSRNQLHKAAKILTRNMMLRNEAYSNLVKHEFSDKIRLSMHPSVNNGNKYSFQLIPSEKAHHSPWHCALVIYENGIMETMHKKDAESAGHHLIMQDGRPYYFLAK